MIDALWGAQQRMTAGRRTNFRLRHETTQPYLPGITGRARQRESPPCTTGEEGRLEGALFAGGSKIGALLGMDFEPFTSVKKALRLPGYRENHTQNKAPRTSVQESATTACYQEVICLVTGPDCSIPSIDEGRRGFCIPSFLGLPRTSLGNPCPATAGQLGEAPAEAEPIGREPRCQYNPARFTPSSVRTERTT